MNSHTNQILQRIVKKTDFLVSSRFMQQLKAEGNRVSFKPGEVEILGPDEEAVKAFILDYRFFIVENEDTSFSTLNKKLATLDVSEKWKTQFLEVRDSLNNFFDATVYKFTVNGQEKPIPYRYIHYTFLYGGLVHANNSKTVKEYEKLKNSASFEIFRITFIYILDVVLYHIRHLSYISTQELGNIDAGNL